MQNFKDFSGSNYFKALDDLNNFIEENGLDVSIKYREKVLPSEMFIDYVTAAEEKYIEYKVKQVQRNWIIISLDYYLIN